MNLFAFSRIHTLCLTNLMIYCLFGIFFLFSLLGVNWCLLLHLPLTCTARSDLESVLASVHETVFAVKKELGEGSNNRPFEAFLNSAAFSKDAEGVSHKSMSLSDFRNWCILLPSLRKFLGNMLMPPDSGLSYLCHSVLLVFLSSISVIFETKQSDPSDAVGIGLTFFC